MILEPESTLKVIGCLYPAEPCNNLITNGEVRLITLTCLLFRSFLALPGEHGIRGAPSEFRTYTNIKCTSLNASHAYHSSKGGSHEFDLLSSGYDKVLQLTHWTIATQLHILRKIFWRDTVHNFDFTFSYYNLFDKQSCKFLPFFERQS